MGTGSPAISITWALALISTLIHPCEGDRRFRRDLSKKIVLDMADSSYDDQYLGCTEAMDNNIPRILQAEKKLNKDFADAWENATGEWEKRKGNTKVPIGFKDEYAISTLVYTNDKPNIYSPFNEAVRQAGKSRDFYLNHFHFKALHYHLTRALQLLDAVESPTCHSVFRGVKTRFTTEQGKQVRFDRFTSSSTDYQKALEFGDDTVFTIITCSGVRIRDLSFFPNEEEVLIPPFEKFKVTDFSTNNNKNKMTLKSMKNHSRYNCALVKVFPVLALCSRRGAEERSPVGVHSVGECFRGSASSWCGTLVDVILFRYPFLELGPHSEDPKKGPGEAVCSLPFTEKMHSTFKVPSQLPYGISRGSIRTIG
ncbi:erythroblast NAD(P)(+)--arginine ADP-ribosyltransferase [Xenopus laevis]|uniref:NAD(P)(+)--arginine ADP-ribosyltransferase n=1 Tax=Xenopus laevis TaxID=8355 RepID=A0A8J1MG65_XENLA|nr:erythroblast NAD(P)(+)--arginine ADP-ribosyltransferase [Xenopus laevis]